MITPFKQTFMEKYSILDGSTPFGAPHVHLIEPGTGYGLDQTADLEKTASGEHLGDVITLIESIAPRPGSVYLLNSSLAAGEVVGFNARGDWFTEAGLVHEPPGWHDVPVWDIDRRRQLANHAEYVPGYGMCAWGYPTFMNAHRFKHHINKDPNKAYGFILGTFWDPRMKRVILVSELREEMCMENGGMDVFAKIKAGYFPDTSMGSKVPYDRCSICGHKAPSPQQYCEHVRQGAAAPYGMKVLLPDGRRCGVYNDQPRFFDDSFVFKGAEKSAKVMADLSPRIRGSHTYSEKIYPFRAPTMKLANEEPQQQSTVSMSPYRLDHQPNKYMLSEEEFGQKLRDASKNMHTTSNLEQVALHYFVERRIMLERLRRGSIAKPVFDHWEVEQQNIFVRQYGVPIDSFRYINDQLTQVHNDLFRHSKEGMSVKWAEMLKEIPIDQHTLAAVRSQVKGFKTLPEDLLDCMSESPRASLESMARLGIVANPQEFQYIMLRRKHPEAAMELHRKGIVFGPRPLPENFLPFIPSKRVAPDILSMLKPFIEDRSLSPKAVRIRMLRTKTANTPKPREVSGYPLLDEMGDVYNQYRAGLLSTPIEYENTHISQTEFADDIVKEANVSRLSVKVADTLVGTAYWSSLHKQFPILGEGL